MKGTSVDQLAAIASFKDYTLNHPHLQLAIKRLRLAINQADHGSIVFMFGPTGVGKSTLATHIRAKLHEEFRQAGEHDASTLPAVVIEAPYPDARQFSWREFYTRALERLCEPLPEKKIEDPREMPAFRSFGRGNPTGHALRAAFEKALEYRKVRVLIVDEAHHIAKGTSAEGLKGMLEYIKSLANLTKKIIVLIGTYDLLSFRNLSGQLSRRSLDVHFPRYRLEDAEEYRIFFGIVKSFATKLPIPCSFQLEEKVEDLYVGSLGCVGILSGWIAKAMTLAIAEGDGTLQFADLERTIYSHDQMSKMVNELLEGEQLLTPPPNSLSILKARLGVAGESGAKPTSPLKPVKNFRPGQRKPVRDPVGSPE